MAASAAAAAAAAGTAAILPRYLAVHGGARHRLPDLLQQIGCKAPFLVTDRFMSEAGHVEELLEALRKAPHIERVHVFDACEAEPTTASVKEAMAVLRPQGQGQGQRLTRFDCVVGVGGGSPMDVAKAVSVLQPHQEIADVKVPARPPNNLPMVAMPTTAGTGSEATMATVIADEDTTEKMLCMAPAFQPVAALVDFEYTLSCPPRLTADTGLDALTHAIEAFVSRRNTPFTDSLALAAMAAVSANIRTVFSHGDDRSARSAMSLAATQAGIAFSNASVALVHGMSRPVGAHFHVPHGLSNAMLLPTLTAFSVPASMQRYAQCSEAMGLVDSAVNEGEAVAVLLEELVQLNADLKVPTMPEYGIDRHEFMQKSELMAKQAMASGSPLNNPRVPTLEEMVDLYAQVYGEDAGAADHGEK